MVRRIFTGERESWTADRIPLFRDAIFLSSVRLLLQSRTACQHRVRSCSIACEHLLAKAILTFLHRWQMNLHEQSWPRTFHTTKEILFVKLSDGDDESSSHSSAMANIRG